MKRLAKHLTLPSMAILIGVAMLFSFVISQSFPPPKSVQAQVYGPVSDAQFLDEISKVLGIPVAKKPVTPVAPPQVAVEPSKPVEAPIPPPQPQQPVERASQLTGFIGSYGWVAPGNNCVAFVRSYTGRSQSGNAGSWYASSSTPWIGAIMIFRPGQQGAGSVGHVAVVVGINGNTIYVAHANWPGQTAFQSTGLFW